MANVKLAGGNQPDTSGAPAGLPSKILHAVHGDAVASDITPFGLQPFFLRHPFGHALQGATVRAGRGEQEQAHPAGGDQDGQRVLCEDTDETA